MRVIRCILSLVTVMLAGVLAQAQEPDGSRPKRIHVVVALCDNDYQGIVKVGAKIGNGDEPYQNLYWGCSDGLWRHFAKSSDWKLIDSKKVKKAAESDDPLAGTTVLETLTYRHTSANAVLVAEAWRGREIKGATVRFLELLQSNAEDAPDLVAYIGHNGLMDFKLPDRATDSAPPSSEPVAKKRKDAVVLCCKSNAYFDGKLSAYGARPILMTEQLMYPGSFLLKAALDGWLAGETRTEIRERAARAYAMNQGISTKAARGVFSDLDGE